MIYVPKRSIIAPRRAAPLAPRRRQEGFIINPYAFGGAAGAGPIVVDAAAFTDTAAPQDHYLHRGSAFSPAASASVSGMFSLWIRSPGTVTAVTPKIGFFDSTNNAVFGMLPSGGNDLSIGLHNGTTSIASFFSSGSPLTANAWHHILAAWTFSGSSVLQLYIDDASSISVSQAHTGGNVGYNGINDSYIGADGIDILFNGGTESAYNGGMAELWFAPGQYLDISVTANRRKFRSSLGKPVDLGSDGSLATGTKPLVYLHLADLEAANNFALNRAGNGDFTVVSGPLSTFATSPSD